MTTIQRGRVTHHHDGDLALFLIGMRVNKPWKVTTWWPLFNAMPRMIRELSQDPDSGFLGARTVIEGRGATVIQYWRTVEDIYRYATDPDREHRPAWREFNRRSRSSGGAVGIWHETFAVPAGQHESVYVDLPSAGLARATQTVAVTAETNRARQRFSGPTAHRPAA